MKTTHRKAIAALLSAMSAGAGLQAATATWTAATGTPFSWIVGSNWGGTAPASGDDVVFSTNPTATSTINLNGAQVIGTLNISSASTLTFAAGTGGTLQINSGITYSTTASDTISAPVILGGNNAWNFGSTGSLFSGFSVSGAISDGGNGFGIIKTGVRALTLSGNNTFTGDFVNKNGAIFAAGFTTANTVLGRGNFVFFNDATANNAAVSLNINSNVSRTYANNFINKNESATQVASIAQSGQGGFAVTTFTGDFTTAGSYNAAQFLNLSGNGNATTGLVEGALVFSGNWSGYAAGSTFNGIRVNGAGTIQLNSAASVAPTNYAITAGETALSAKLLTNVASNFSINQTVSFTNAVNTRRHTFGAISSGFTTTLAGEASTGTAVNIGAAGANLVAGAGAGLAVTGNVLTTAGTGLLTINEGYAYSGTGTTNVLVTPTGTVTLSGNGNTYSGGTVVSNGTLLVDNTSGSATGTGSVSVGTVGAVVTSQAGTAATSTRVITAVANGAAGTLQVGQSISGTGIPGGAKITGINIGATTATITIDQTTTSAVTAFTTTSFASTATLGGTGTISGATTINDGSTLSPGMVSGGSGLLSFGSTLALSGTSISTFDINGATRGSGYDAVNVIGALTYGGTMSLRFNVPVQAGTYNLFDGGTNSGDFSSVSVGGTAAPSFTSSPSFTSGTGWSAADATFNYVFDNASGELLISSAIPEPSTFAALAGLGVLGLAAYRRRRS